VQFSPTSRHIISLRSKDWEFKLTQTFFFRKVGYTRLKFTVDSSLLASDEVLLQLCEERTPDFVGAAVNASRNMVCHEREYVLKICHLCSRGDRFESQLGHPLSYKFSCFSQSLQLKVRLVPTRRSEFESQWRQEFSLLHVVQTGSGAHPVSYPMGTGGSYPGGKASIHPLPHTSSWCSA
jgi:hypothetical protein